jgi:hypothetical protein
MKKINIILLLSFLASFSFAQNKSDYAGMWKSTVKAGNKPTVPTYILLDSNGTYLWGIDSTQTDPMKNTSKGTWDITSENEIKFTTESTPIETKYYVPKGENLYEYMYFDNEGKKTIVGMLEMSLYLQKVNSGK